MTEGFGLSFAPTQTGKANQPLQEAIRILTYRMPGAHQPAGMADQFSLGVPQGFGGFTSPALLAGGSRISDQSTIQDILNAIFGVPTAAPSAGMGQRPAPMGQMPTPMSPPGQVPSPHIIPGTGPGSRQMPPDWALPPVNEPIPSAGPPRYIDGGDESPPTTTYPLHGQRPVGEPRYLDGGEESPPMLNRPYPSVGQPRYGDDALTLLNQMFRGFAR